MNNNIPRYGVHKQARSDTEVDKAIEMIRLIGYAVIDGAYSPADIVRFSTSFDRALTANYERYGIQFLRKIDEHNTIRALLAIEPDFLGLALNPLVLAICRRLMGEYIILHQQNAVINPPNAQHYAQAAFHRDLPYQHFVSSHPLAINALYCIDDFTSENGGTCVLPASHKSEDFPSDATAKVLQTQISAKAGSFIVIDSMLYHCGGVNCTDAPRRAVSHLYSIPILRPQINLPAILGDDYTSDLAIRRLLGYEIQTPQDIAIFYESRLAKATNK